MTFDQWCLVACIPMWCLTVVFSVLTVRNLQKAEQIRSRGLWEDRRRPIELAQLDEHPAARGRDQW